jgi:hypothetical protein
VELLPTEAGGDCLEELQELGSVGLGAALADHSSGCHFDGGVRAGDSDTTVVVDLAGRESGADRQQRLSSFQGLDCVFSSKLSTTALVGGLRYRPTTSWIRSSACGSVMNLNVSRRCGLRSWAFQMRWTVVWETPVRRACPLAQTALGLLEGDGHDLSALARGNDRGPTRARTLEDARDTLFGDPAPDAAHLHSRVPAAARHQY